jgi:hypothetical protein
MINLEKNTEMAKGIFVANLEKKAARTGTEYDIEAAVKLILDISGSMQNVYYNNIVQDVLTRIFPTAILLDDDGKMQVVPFSNNSKILPVEVDAENYQDFILKEVLNKKESWYFGGTEYLPFLKEVEKDYDKNNRPGFFKKKRIIPSLCICVVDGDTRNVEAVKRKIVELAAKPIYFIFIGIETGCSRFGFLETIDDMQGREIDNVSFYKANDITRFQDEQLYDVISKNYIDWFYQMKQLGKI